MGQAAYGTGAGHTSAYNTTFPATWPNWGISRISDGAISFKKVDGTIVSNYAMDPKAIHDEMGATFDDYGRMSAKLGLELPFTNAAIANFVLQNFVDPPTEVVNPNETQIWRITHNGVDTHPINLNRSGTGSGVVTSNPTGIDCGSACSASFAGETTVTLTAVPSAGSVFKSWSGCTSSGNKCTVVMNNAKTVTAAFAVANPVKLTVSKVKQASGDGAVTSSPAGIDCGKTCSGLYAPGTSVTLSAAVSSLSTFGGWSLPSCGGTGACTFTMDKAQTVKATFIGPQVLTVTNTSASKGKGTIMTDSGNIACERGTCKGSFLYNTVVTLTAAADSGSNSVFAGWSGCTTQSPTTCTVTMDKAQSVKGTFTGPQTLTVANSSVNRGTGTVTSNPEGVACAKGTCKTPFVYKLEVTLSASADPGSYFMGWSGACSGTDDCFVTMDKARSVTAKFKKGSAPALGEEAVSVE